MWFGTEGGVSRYNGTASQTCAGSNQFVNFTQADGLIDNEVYSIHGDPDGVMWFGTRHLGVSRYDGKGFVNFARNDGSSPSWRGVIGAIHRADDGVLWFGSGGGGIACYEEQTFATLTSRDGFSHNTFSAIHLVPDGALWATTNLSLSRYDGERVINFPAGQDGLQPDVGVIHRGPDGALWLASGTRSWTHGVSRYDGESQNHGSGAFANFTAQDGLIPGRVHAIGHDANGAMWFGAMDGVSRYDGKSFVNLTTADGLGDNWVNAFYADSDGVLWFGTLGGISRYDGKWSTAKSKESGGFINFTTADGLAHDWVYAFHQDPDGVMWIGTLNGVSRFRTGFNPEKQETRDGQAFVTFTTQDGLAANRVCAICQDTDGIIWFATEGGGVSGYDGVAWTSLDTRDGLQNDNIYAIVEDSHGTLWFGTDDGLTRYRRTTSVPRVHVVSATIDETTYTVDADDALSLYDMPAFTAETRVTIRYNAIDFKTIPEKRQYRCRIKEVDKDWRPPTRADSFDYTFDETGTFTFEVQAIDRDLNYSEPATVNLTVQPDPRLVALQTEVNALRREVGQKYHFENIIGRSAAIKQVRVQMEKAIDSGLTVLITGETGTGKELVAKGIHYNSPRKNKPLLDRNCGTFPKDLIASELFGHRKGAFTGATENKAGLFESANGGTVILDEVGEMPEEAQVHLLRVLQERKLQRVGEYDSHDVDVRVIAITNRDLAAEVEAGRFREDLYHRLDVFPIHVPPLRERLDDLPILAEHLLQKACQQQGKTVDGFTDDVFEMLSRYPWTGNIRELENQISRAVALVEESLRIETYHFSSQITSGESLMQEIILEEVGLKASVEHLERRLIEDVLRRCEGNRTQAAKMLDIDRKTLYDKMNRLNIDIPPQTKNQ